MKTPFKNIYAVLRINRFIVWSVVLTTMVTNIVLGLIVYKLHRESQQEAFAISTDGNVLPLHIVSQQENLEVEALAHIALFHRYFYHIDASNFEKNLDKALWLGNSSVDALYRQKKADGVYNRLIQYSLVQKIQSITTTLDIKSQPYTFQTTTIFEINRGLVTDKYELQTSGKLLPVDRNFPKNTHGLLITDFYENSLKKLPNEN